MCVLRWHGSHRPPRERGRVCVCAIEREAESVWESKRERERESEKEKDDSVSISSRVEIFVDRGRAVFKLDPPKKARQKIPPKKLRSKKNILLLFKGKPPKQNKNYLRLSRSDSFPIRFVSNHVPIKQQKTGFAIFFRKRARLDFGRIKTILKELSLVASNRNESTTN